MRKLGNLKEENGFILKQMDKPVEKDEDPKLDGNVDQVKKYDRIDELEQTHGILLL